MYPAGVVNLLNTVRDLDRLRQIVATLTRHGFGELVQRTGLESLLPGESTARSEKLALGERVRCVLTDLGPSFVKLGQIASTRPDLVPEPVLRELKKLQDEVPPESFGVVRTTVERELGAPLSELFESFEETPLASASIAQVHRAVLRTEDGPVDVVVKVQRSGVEQTVTRDIDLLYWLAHLVERTVPEARIYAPVKLVQEFDRSMRAELDFVQEAENAERFAQNFADRPRVRFPKVYRQASGRRVLTLEYIDGVKVDRAVAEGYSGESIAKLAVDMIIKMIFEDGFFHADPHPGNVFVTGDREQPTLVLIDLGLVGRLSPKLRDRTVDLMVAAVREDYVGIADALYQMGRPTRKFDRREFEAEVTMLAQKYLGRRLQDIELSALVRDLAHGARKYGIEPPPEFLMVGRAMMTIEGVGKEIYPELDVFSEVKPYFLRLMAERYAPERVAQEVMRALMRTSGAVQDLPLQVQEILEDLRRGSFSMRISGPDLNEAADVLGRRIFSGLGVAALIVGAALLAANGHHYVAAAAFLLAVAWSFLHTMAVTWLDRRRRKRLRREQP